MSANLPSLVQRYTRWAWLSGLAGVLSGLAATVFLHLLDGATRIRDSHPGLIWLLPLAGFAVGWLYHRFGASSARGNALILEEIQDPKAITPLQMSPLILVGTVLTHLFGGSAGREGTAVQMGASLSDQLSRWFRVAPADRRVLLVAGAGAGFGAAIGTPWAGMIFGMEVIRAGRLPLFAPFECLIASWVAYGVTRLLHAPHSVFIVAETVGFSWTPLLGVAFAGIAFGLSARVFVLLTHAIERASAALLRYPPLRPAVAGLLLVGIYALEGSYRYVGLGIPWIQEALSAPASFEAPIWKALLSALTVGAGFKGGEFIPLVFIGTTLGSALSALIPVPLPLLASVGFAAVFGGAAKTPIACTIMAIELFGPWIAPYAAIACAISVWVSGPRGIYHSRKPKPSR